MGGGGKKETPSFQEAVAGALDWGLGALGAGPSPALNLTMIWSNFLPVWASVSTSNSDRICI